MPCSAQAGQGLLTWWLRLRVAAQCAAATAYLHTLPPSAGGPLIHRDIKPANMFLDGRLNAKLGDVGLATSAGSGSSSSSSATGGGQDMVGTYPYLAPEYRASGTVSLKTDVYALGVSLLQLATGQQERLQELVQRCREAVAAGAGASILDPSAGTWDEAAGQRLLSLGLWCCSESAHTRPTSSVLAQELAKLHEATDQARRAAVSWWPHSSNIDSRGTGQVPGGISSGESLQHSVTALNSSVQGSNAAAGGGFWRFLTGAT